MDAVAKKNAGVATQLTSAAKELRAASNAASKVNVKVRDAGAVLLCDSWTHPRWFDRPALHRGAIFHAEVFARPPSAFSFSRTFVITPHPPLCNFVFACRGRATPL